MNCLLADPTLLKQKDFFYNTQQKIFFFYLRYLFQVFSYIFCHKTFTKLGSSSDENRKPQNRLKYLWCGTVATAIETFQSTICCMR